VSAWGMLRAPAMTGVSCISLCLLITRGILAAETAERRALMARQDFEAAPEPPIPTPEVAPSRFQLGVGAGLTLGLGEVWEGDGDVVKVTGPPTFLELSLAPSYRVAPELALGVRAAFGLQPSSRAEVSNSVNSAGPTRAQSVSLERNMWQLGGTARYQSEPARAWYFGAHAGAAAVVDSRGDASVSQWAPHVGAAVGYDLRVARPLSLGFELRAAYAPFGEGSHTSSAGFYDYQVSTWLGFGLIANVLP